jgi:outer membrane protein TolC
MNRTSCACRGASARFFIIYAVLMILSSLTISRLYAQAVSPGAGPATIPATVNEPEVQLVQPAGQTAPPLTITLQDAQSRAQKYNADYLSATIDAKSAHEDALQARNARLPSVNYRMDYLGTEGNGKLPSGRFVTNDGVHVYRVWGMLHQDFTMNTLTGLGSSRAAAVEAVAKAKADIARRGLAVTVTKNYAALIVAQRKYATAQQTLAEAQRFYGNTQDSERQGQSSHNDVVKAQLQYEQQDQAFEEAKLAMEDSRLNLAVLLFPDLNENFTVVDDLDSPPSLPAFADVQSMAEKVNPDLRVAVETARQADFDVTAARNSFLPTLTLDAVYGIEANAFALHSTAAADPRAGVLPNLGYFITASLNVPVWDWGTLRSKLRQAQFKQQQAHIEITQTQREQLSNLYASYNEALVARSAVARLRAAADAAAENLRLVNLRYQAGESSAFEVVDAQNTNAQARNAYDDTLARYRVALTTLQTITGNF